jgi:hypothetical protein
MVANISHKHRSNHKQRNLLLMLLILAAAFATTYGASAESKKPNRDDLALDPRYEQVGTWKCSGTTTAPYGTERPYYGTMENDWTLDHKWMVIHYTEEQPVTPVPFIEDQYWGYTPADGKHARTLMANDGSFGILHSDGWQGNMMTWAGTYTVGSATYLFKEGVERQTATRYRWYGSIEDNGTVLVEYDVTCKKR